MVLYREPAVSTGHQPQPTRTIGWPLPVVMEGVRCIGCHRRFGKQKPCHGLASLAERPAGCEVYDRPISATSAGHFEAHRRPLTQPIGLNEVERSSVLFKRDMARCAQDFMKGDMVRIPFDVAAMLGRKREA